MNGNNSTLAMLLIVLCCGCEGGAGFGFGNNQCLALLLIVLCCGCPGDCALGQ